MGAKAILTLEKIRTDVQLRGRAQHNFRTGTNHNADPERTQYNVELIKTDSDDEKDYAKSFRRKMKENKLRNVPRKNSVRSFEVVMTYSGKPNDNFSIEEWSAACTEWVKKEFGEGNVYSAILHMDEKTPHIHAMIIPINEKGELNASSFIAGRESLRAMQTSFAEDMKQFGLERGQIYSTANNQDLARFHGAVSEAAVKELPPLLEGETALDYKIRAEAEFQKREFQHINEVNELKNQFGVSHGKIFETEIKEKELKSKEVELEERERICVSREKEVHLNESKIRFAESLKYALDANNNCPDFIVDDKQGLKKIISRASKWGLENMPDEEREKLSGIASGESGKNENRTGSALGNDTENI